MDRTCHIPPIQSNNHCYVHAVNVLHEYDNRVIVNVCMAIFRFFFFDKRTTHCMLIYEGEMFDVSSYPSIE